MVVEVAVALCCWCWCSCVGAREKICVRDAFGAHRERRVVSARIIEREKRKGDVVDFYTGILCSQSGAKKSGRRFDCTQRKGEGDAPSTPLVASSSKALCALLFAARARSFFFFFLRCSKSTLSKSLPFFSSPRESKVPCSVCVVVFVVVVASGTKTALAFFASQSWFLCLLWEKMRLMGETTAMVLSKKKTMYLRQSRLVSLSSLSFHSVFFFGPGK